MVKRRAPFRREISRGDAFYELMNRYMQALFGFVAHFVFGVPPAVMSRAAAARDDGDEDVSFREPGPSRRKTTASRRFPAAAAAVLPIRTSL